MKLIRHKFRVALALAQIPAVRLARDLGISRDRISFFENGHAEPDDQLAAKIAERLGVPVCTIFEPENSSGYEEGVLE